MRRTRSHGRRLPFRVVGFALALATSLPGTLLAHGRFPASNGIAFDPARARHAIVRMTYGLYDVENVDDGEQGAWRWVCAPAAGYDPNALDPPLTFAGDRLVLGTFTGLVVGTPDGCGFAAAPELVGRYVVDVAALPRTDAPAMGSPVLALSANGVAADQFEVGLFESTDGAATWHALPTAFPQDFLAVSLLAARSKADALAWGAIYVSGRDGTMTTGYRAVVLRSDDGGATWVRHELADLDGGTTLPYLQGVGSEDGLTVFAAAITDAAPVRKQSNRISLDGGATWSAYAEADEILPGWTLSPDGSRVAWGGEKTGLRIAPLTAIADPSTHAKVNSLRVGCLNWNDSGLHACANAFVDGFSLGRSTDGGETFESLMQLTSACGPKECAPTSVVGETCADLWTIEAKEIVAPTTCDAPAPPTEVGGCDCAIAGGGGSARFAASWGGLLGAAVAFGAAWSRRLTRGRRARRRSARSNRPV